MASADLIIRYGEREFIRHCEREARGNPGKSDKREESEMTG